MQPDVKQVASAELEERLRAFEDEYGMTSEQLYERAHAGALDETDALLDWLGHYEAYLRLRQ